jgi:hypothetical protein
MLGFSQIKLILAGVAALAFAASLGGAYLKGRSDGRTIERAAAQAANDRALDAAQRAGRDRALRDLTDPRSLSEPDRFRRD